MIEEIIDQMQNQQLVKQPSVFACAVEEPPILIEDEMQVDSQKNNEGSSSSYTFGGEQYPGMIASNHQKKNIFFDEQKHHFANCPSYLGISNNS
jgi:hypothetical protein